MSKRALRHSVTTNDETTPTPYLIKKSPVFFPPSIPQQRSRNSSSSVNQSLARRTSSTPSVPKNSTQSAQTNAIPSTSDLGSTLLLNPPQSPIFNEVHDDETAEY